MIEARLTRALPVSRSVTCALTPSAAVTPSTEIIPIADETLDGVHLRAAARSP